MRNTVIKKVFEQAMGNDNIFLITGDAGFGVLDEFRRHFPHRFLNLGIAEQNMISFASGLALTGFKVVVYNIIPFLMYRCYEQVRNDICYQRLPVVLIGIGSGVTYAPAGITHYAVEDLNIALSLPNLTIFSPTDPFEAESCIEYALKADTPVYIRIAKSGEPVFHKNKPLDITLPLVMREGSKVAVLYHGSISVEVMEAIKDIPYQPKIVSLPLIHPIRYEILLEVLKNIETIITVEEHFINGGLGSILADWISTNRLNFKIVKLGIKNEFLHLVKNTSSYRKHYKIHHEYIRRLLLEVYE